MWRRGWNPLAARLSAFWTPHKAKVSKQKWKRIRNNSWWINPDTPTHWQLQASTLSSTQPTPLLVNIFQILRSFFCRTSFFFFLPVFESVLLIFLFITSPFVLPFSLLVLGHKIAELSYCPTDAPWVITVTPSGMHISSYNSGWTLSFQLPGVPPVSFVTCFVLCFCRIHHIREPSPWSVSHKHFFSLWVLFGLDKFIPVLWWFK